MPIVFLFQPPPNQGAGGVFIVLGMFAIPAIIMGIAFGKPLVAKLREDQRKMFGTLLVIVGGVLILFGGSTANSVGLRTYDTSSGPWFSRVTESSEGLIGLATICTGELVALIGVVTLIKKAGAKTPTAPSSKQCPFCAETIQAAAKLCRYCGKSLEDAHAPASNT